MFIHPTCEQLKKKKKERMKDIYMNSSNPVTKLYTTLDLTILSELIRAILKILGLQI